MKLLLDRGNIALFKSCFSLRPI